MLRKALSFGRTPQLQTSLHKLLENIQDIICEVNLHQSLLEGLARLISLSSREIVESLPGKSGSRYFGHQDNDEIASSNALLMHTRLLDHLNVVQQLGCALTIVYGQSA
jgi:hypothetical protein